MPTNLEELYQHLKPLSPQERLRLIEMLARELGGAQEQNQPPQRDLMELHGLGAEIWQGVDAQEYVNRLREE
jgi:hypothetical protein